MPGGVQRAGFPEVKVSSALREAQSLAERERVCEHTLTRDHD